jgi:hypothetical protein
MHGRRSAGAGAGAGGAFRPKPSAPRRDDYSEFYSAVGIPSGDGEAVSNEQ